MEYELFRVCVMRIARFGDNRLGLVDGYVLRDITQVTERLPQYRWPFPKGDQFVANLVWLNDAPMLPGRRYLIRMGSQSATVSVTALKHRIDLSLIHI